MHPGQNPRWFLPREHGAWGIVSIPFLTAIVIAGRFNPAVVIALASVLLAFIARYPLELLLVPGLFRRAGSPSRERVYRFAWIYGLLAAVAAMALLTIWKLYLLIPVGLAAAVLFLAHLWEGRRGDDRSWLSELLGTAGLTLSGLVGWVATTGGLDATGLLVWWLNCIFFCVGIVYVKARIRGRLAVHRPELWRSIRFMVTLHVLAVAFVVTLVWWRALSPLLMIPFAIAALRAGWGARQAERPFALTRLGWSEVALSLVFATFITLGFRW